VTGEATSSPRTTEAVGGSDQNEKTMKLETRNVASELRHYSYIERSRIASKTWFVGSDSRCAEDDDVVGHLPHGWYLQADRPESVENTR
jgi:hypothetical protein